MHTHLPRTRSLIGALASAAILVVAMMAPALADHDDDHTALQDAVADAQDAVDDAQDNLDDFIDSDDASVYDNGKCSAAGGNKDLKDECDALVKALKDAEDDLADAIAALEAWEEPNTEEPQDQQNSSMVWVCKMVGEPGNAVLASGENPIWVNEQAAQQIFSDAHASFIVDGPGRRCEGEQEQSNPVNDENDNSENNEPEETTTSSSSGSSSGSSSSDDEPVVLAEVLEADDEAVVMGETLAFTGASTPTLGGFGLALLAAGAWVLRRSGVAASA
jgi:hypothetical protein